MIVSLYKVKVAPMTDKTIKNPDSSAETVRCSHCGSEYSGKLQKCPVCGRSVSRDRFSWLNRFLGGTGDLSLEDVQAVRDFVVRNLEPLREYWNQKLSFDDLLVALRRTV